MGIAEFDLYYDGNNEQTTNQRSEQWLAHRLSDGCHVRFHDDFSAQLHMYQQIGFDYLKREAIVHRKLTRSQNCGLVGYQTFHH